MTNPDLSAIAVVLDRSGSMDQIKEAAEEGLQGFIAEQARQPTEAGFTLITFDTQFEIVYANTPIKDVGKVVIEPRGATALYDAVAFTISTLSVRFQEMDEAERPGAVVVAIVTDGYENSSVQHDWQSISALIKQQEDEWNWQFLYLSAGPDAMADADHMGIRRDHTHTFRPSGASTRSAYGAMGQTVSTYRRKMSDAGAAGGQSVNMTIDPGEAEDDADD